MEAKGVVSGLQCIEGLQGLSRGQKTAEQMAWPENGHKCMVGRRMRNPLMDIKALLKRSETFTGAVMVAT